MSTSTGTVAPTEEALSTGLIAVDASRRVGWAKAFEALRRVDGLEEEVRQMRAERIALRRAYSRLLGFVSGLDIQRSGVFDEELSAHQAAEMCFRHEDAYYSGLARAREHETQRCGLSEEEALAREAMRKSFFRRVDAMQEESKRAGHRMSLRVLDEDGGVFESHCRCGATSGPVTRNKARAWARDHDTQALYGISFAEFKRQYKEECSTNRANRGEQ